MATHSSVLAWRIPGTGEPGGLPSMGLHRVGHDWGDLAAEDTDSCSLCSIIDTCHLSVLYRVVCVCFPDRSAGKESACNAGDPGSIPGSGTSRGERHRLPTPVFLGFPSVSAGNESAWQCGRPGFDPWVRKIPWRRAWQTTPVFWPGWEIMKDREAWGTSVHRAARSQTWLNNHHHNVHKSLQW